MEIIQYKTKKTIAIIMLVIMIMSIATPVFAATGKIALNKSSMTLKVGDKGYITATTNTTTQFLHWHSSNNSVVKVISGTQTTHRPRGTIEGVGAGTATITAQTEDGKVKASCKVTVTEGNVTSNVKGTVKEENVTSNVKGTGNSVDISGTAGSNIGESIIGIGGAIVGGLVNVATSETTTAILGKIVDIIMNILKTVFSSLSSISIKVPETVTPNSGTTTTNNVIDTSTARYLEKKYTGMTEQQKKQLAYIAYKEQGSVGGAKIELSLMANRTEYCGHSSVYNYVMNSGWFYLPKTGQVPSNPNVSQSYIDAVEEVLVEGKRYLPSKVVEHDCIKDISSISTGDKSNRSYYIPDETIIKNKYGSTYVFFGFAPDGGDPFGYFQ